MTWDEATAEVAKLGPGWRLPTIEEFREVLYPNREKLFGKTISFAYYWSSTERDANIAWFFNVYNGNAHDYFKLTTSYVRAVRDITGEIAIGLLLKNF
jgi:hypothetical protein